MRFALPGSSWTSSSKEQNGPLAKAIKELCKERGLDQGTLSIWLTELSFYSDNVRLICVELPELNNGNIYFLKTIDSENQEIDYHMLNGHSGPIHRVNSDCGIALNNQNIVDYLYFFGFFVHASEGPFYTITTRDDKRIDPKVWSGATAIPTLQFEPLAGFFRPPCIRAETNEEANQFHVSALVYYGTSISIGDFLVDGEGVINMLNDEPLVCDLPSRIEINLTP